jgi:putative DNA primase/helicase
MIFSRILALGNAQMRSLFDHSDGFLRRQIIIKPKPKLKDRVDDLTLDEKLLNEKSQIFNWCFQGLQQLIKDGFHFFVSDRTKANLEAAREDNCNVADFLENSGCIRFDLDSTIASTRLVALYQEWCRDNAIDPLADRTMLNYVKSNAEKYEVKEDYHVLNDQGRRCRGFSGIQQITALRFD